MKTISYVGASRSGIYQMPGDLFVEWGGSIEVDDDLADELLGRKEADGSPCWKAVKPAKSTDKES